MLPRCLLLSRVTNCAPLSAWLSGYESPVVSRINTRIQDLTGLDVSTAEELQVSVRMGLVLDGSQLFSISLWTDGLCLLRGGVATKPHLQRGRNKGVFAEQLFSVKWLFGAERKQ